jgi:hypothetical protein
LNWSLNPSDDTSPQRLLQPRHKTSSQGPVSPNYITRAMYLQKDYVCPAVHAEAHLCSHSGEEPYQGYIFKKAFTHA